MAIFEVRGGRVTARYLERKYTKAELAHEYMKLLRELERADARIDELEARLKDSG